MALEDAKVVVAAQGFVYINNTLGALAPTPAQITAFDPTSFGGQVSNIKITGAPTGGTFTLTVTVGAGSPQTTGTIAYNASPSAVQTAVESLSSVGAGNTSISGVSISDSNGYNLGIAGALLGQTATITAASGALTGGTTPTVVVTTPTVPNGWVNVGHTSRSKMPEFGYDGAKLEMKGSWQKQRLRQVWGAQPIEDKVKVHLEQFNRHTLELYFGADVALTDGVYGVSGNWNPVQKSFLVVLVDPFINLACYASKASIARDAAADIPLDDFASLPIAATFLNLGTRRLYDWIGEETIGPVGS
jgi:hypothetical protein